MNRVHALMISAPASGQGKTSVTLALARKLARAGKRVRVFKAGADFLDPLLLERACGSPVYVLDLWMVGSAQCRHLLRKAAEEADVVLVEGVMGLYDGTPSSADLAREFGLAVLAVIDVGAMAETIGAVAMGLRDFGPVSLAGVAANRVAGPGHARMLRAALGAIPLLAQLPHLPHSLAERHLGLVPPAEAEDLDAAIGALADSLSIEAQWWEPLARPEWSGCEPAQSLPQERPLAGKTIAIARDAAFAFLYPANIDCLQRLGATIRSFSPLADEPVPARASAVWLPGGYPELHGERLAGALQFQHSLRQAHGAGLPILAECGGMMVAAEAMFDAQERRWPMARLLPGITRMHAGVKAIGPQEWRTAQGGLRGHTFHHSSFATTQGAIGRTICHPSGKEGECIYRVGSLTASYFHAYFDSCPAAVSALLGGAGH